MSQPKGTGVSLAMLKRASLTLYAQERCPFVIPVAYLQDRDLDGFLATRQAMLNARANVNVHWVGVAVAHHLCGNHDMALQVLDLYKSVTSDAKEGAEDEAFEASEVSAFC